MISGCSATSFLPAEVARNARDSGEGVMLTAAAIIGSLTAAIFFSTATAACLAWVSTLRTATCAFLTSFPTLTCTLFTSLLTLVWTCLTRSEEHTSELQSLMRISYAVFCLKKKNKRRHTHNNKHKT